MASLEIDYQELVRDVLRGVVRLALEPVAEKGLPGDHHFFLTFRTGDPGVVLSPQLAAAYPEEMTVVLQHEFHDLVVGEEAFSVSLRFGGRPERITVPYSALTSFVDPAAEFGLQWDEVGTEETAADEPASPAGPKSGDSNAAPGTILPFDDSRRG